MKKNSHRKTGLVLFLLIIGLLFASCSKSDEQESIKENIKTVVGLQLNAPDENAIFHNYISDSLEEDEKGFEEYNNYLKETYAAYFTESTFMQYVMMNEFAIFHDSADKFNYQLKVNNVEVEQNEVTPTNYDFTVNLDYLNKNGNKTEIELTGIAIMRDDKIAKLSYIGDKKVLKSLLNGGLD
ncbi:hypothetical protein [Sporosarcina highlanderae]|uniref:Lipoprotein n=1 Tax=Sporosarcina highlanderae TaxID=3035916 RepID=A0ABT8JTI2_9BACL|nr:hypothetical protein [Sporosarcina highlanderae]MDN4608484.1 hypothetical protein [Sporosarcina highlanderae]